MAEGARCGHSPHLTRETAAGAVLKMGFPQLAFTAVRERLGVGESTLFRYASGCDELVCLGLGLAMKSVEMPPRQGPWRQVLTDYAVLTWRFWEAHPSSTTGVSRGAFILVMMRLPDELYPFPMECGFTTRNALLTCDLTFSVVVDSRRGVERMDRLSTETGPERDGMKRQWIPGEPEENPVPGWERIRQVKLEAINLPPFDWFMKKLEMILTEAAASLAPRE